MNLPAARLGDMHICPVLIPIPHIGGQICTPGSITVLIGGMPAAAIGSIAICVGPPDMVIKGSSTVLIAGKPAARMGDSCAHGGTIALGCFTVLIA